MTRTIGVLAVLFVALLILTGPALAAPDCGLNTANQPPARRSQSAL